MPAVAPTAPRALPDTAAPPASPAASIEPAPPGRTDAGSAPRDRQCGRCRQYCSTDPALDPNALEDWWLCGPCRAKLF